MKNSIKMIMMSLLVVAGLQSQISFASQQEAVVAGAKKVARGAKNLFDLAGNSVQTLALGMMSVITIQEKTNLERSLKESLFGKYYNGSSRIVEAAVPVFIALVIYKACGSLLQTLSNAHELVKGSEDKQKADAGMMSAA